MIMMLTSDQVSTYWEQIEYAASRSLPPIVTEDPSKMQEILASLLRGRMQCWVSYENGESGAVIDTIVLTTPMEDFCSGDKNLLIYSIYGYRPQSVDGWIQGLDGIRAWAKARGYKKLVGYTNSSMVIDRVIELGGTAEYTFISFDVTQTGAEHEGLQQISA